MQEAPSRGSFTFTAESKERKSSKLRSEVLLDSALIEDCLMQSAHVGAEEKRH